MTLVGVLDGVADLRDVARVTVENDARIIERLVVGFAGGDVRVEVDAAGADFVRQVC